MRLLCLAALLLAGCKTPEGATGQGGAQFKTGAATLPGLPIQAIFEVCWPLDATPVQRVTLVTLSDGRVMFDTVEGATNATGRCLVEIASSYPPQPGSREVAPPIRAPSGWAKLGYVQLLAASRFGPERGILDPAPLVNACISKGDGLRQGTKFLVFNDAELIIQLVDATGAQLPPMTNSERCVEAVLGATAWPSTRSYTLEFESASAGGGNVDHYFPIEGAAVALDPNKVKEALSTQASAVTGCWESALKRRGGLGGGRSVRFRVDSAGQVTHVAVVGNVSNEASTAGDYLLDLCLADVVKGARFPAGNEGAAAYSWIFARR